jgi:hypothetical protein
LEKQKNICSQNAEILDYYDFAVKFRTLTYFTLKKTKVKSDLKYGSKSFFSTCLYFFHSFPDTAIFDRSLETHDAPENFEKIHTYTEGNEESIPSSGFHLALLVRP